MRDIIAMRANGSREIGSGHIRRTSLLAEAFAQHGVSPILLCNAQAPDVYPALNDVFDAVHIVSDEASAVKMLQQQYPERLLSVLFDTYDLSAPDHKLYRTCALHLAALDDLAARQMDVDLLFDVNLGREVKDYAGLVPPTASVHVGSDYQILRPDFFEMRAKSLARRENLTRIERVFIALGGTDPLEYSQATLRTVLELAPEMAVDVVIGSASPGLEALKKFAMAIGDPVQVQVHVDATEVAALMTRADLAIGAGGTMTWERNCLGLPTLTLIIADNQLEVANFMQTAKAAIAIDARQGYPEVTVSNHLAEMIHSPDLCRTLSQNAAGLSGCNGTQNIVQTLLLQPELQNI